MSYCYIERAYSWALRTDNEFLFYWSALYWLGSTLVALLDLDFNGGCS